MAQHAAGLQLLTNLHYILGVNPRRFSYVSGYGSDSVTAIYSNIWG